MHRFGLLLVHECNPLNFHMKISKQVDGPSVSTARLDDYFDDLSLEQMSRMHFDYHQFELWYLYTPRAFAKLLECFDVDNLAHFDPSLALVLEN